MLAKAYNGKIYVLSSCSNNCKSKQGEISPHIHARRQYSRKNKMCMKDFQFY